MNPFSLLNLNMQMTALVCETQTVMALRLMGMSGAIPATDGENTRMFAEKPGAMMDAYAEGTKAMMAGYRPDQVALATMAPLGRTVRANRKRLMGDPC